MEAERQLRSAGAGAYDDESSKAVWSRLQFFLNCRPSLQKELDGFDGDGVFGRAGCPTNGWRGSGVNGEYVESNGRPLPAVYFAVLKVQRHCGIWIELRVRKLAEWKQANVAFGKGIVSGDMPGKHPGVRRFIIRRHERKPNAGQRAHPELFQHGEVGVSSAKQNNFFSNGNGDGHRGWIFNFFATDSISFR